MPMIGPPKTTCYWGSALGDLVSGQLVWTSIVSMRPRSPKDWKRSVKRPAWPCRKWGNGDQRTLRRSQLLLDILASTNYLSDREMVAIATLTYVKITDTDGVVTEPPYPWSRELRTEFG